MDWLEKMNRAIEYIEENLEDKVDCDDISKITCCSSYHFHRMFLFITDISLSEYIRRRRLTKAAFEIQNTKNKIIDIALKYGYDSPNSFARAFQNLHGITPASARNEGVVLKAFPRMTFQITIKGDVGMMYKTQEKEAMTLIGKCIMVNLDQYRQNSINFREEVLNSDQFNGLKKATKNNTFYGVTCYRDNNENDSFSYHIACEGKDSSNIPNDYEILNIPKRKWVIIDATEFMPKLWNGWEKVYTQLLPTLGFSQTVGPELEVFHNDGRCEFWISAPL